MIFSRPYPHIRAALTFSFPVGEVWHGCSAEAAPSAAVSDPPIIQVSSIQSLYSWLVHSLSVDRIRVQPDHSIEPARSKMNHWIGKHIGKFR